jgi:hypothetical protein
MVRSIYCFVLLACAQQHCIVHAASSWHEASHSITAAVAAIDPAHQQHCKFDPHTRAGRLAPRLTWSVRDVSSIQRSHVQLLEVMQMGCV